MNRAKYGLDLIALDLKNARARQRLRLKKQKTQSLEIDKVLRFITINLRMLRRDTRKLEQLEKKEELQALRRRNEAGRNSMVSTYGR